MCLTLFICYVICSQGIMGIYADENNKESSDIQIRKKRIIDQTPGGDQPVNIETVPYIVQIHVKGNLACAGSILLPDIIITCAHCAHEETLSELRVLSGSAIENRGRHHRVKGKIADPTYRSGRHWDDLIMLIISPPIDIIHSPNRPIEIYSGPIPINQYAIVSGWGCNRASEEKRNEIQHPGSLRSIMVQIINYQLCLHVYKRYNIPIIPKNICTYDYQKMKRCSFGDSGNPLVMHGKLIAVHGWNASEDPEQHPDVYMYLGNPEYNNWIRRSLAAHVQNELEIL